MEFVPAGTRKLAVGRSLFNIWICQEILLRGNRTALMKAFECARVRAALSVCPELRSRLGPEYSSHHTALMRFTLFKEKFYCKCCDTSYHYVRCLYLSLHALVSSRWPSHLTVTFHS
ncbi:hypothetical protein H1C71_012587 [Ictidomys tridecemlineatus]|nr:hypothetical protein H1C71_012587 [Ictidomys tridecemlineatus]KAG3291259.1 hypothetical protein H1C71_012587 [Ictidomys tridecemlineatus]KAG3291260.1 hypothetical protein H1C71_012587 [Ictidomys tridecemlineatus]